MQRMCTQMCMLMSNLFNLHTCTYMVLKYTCLNAYHTLRQNAHALVHARLCNGAETSLPWKLLRTVLTLVQTSCRLSFAARLATVSTISVAWRCSLKKTVKIHASSWCGRRCNVAQTPFDHLRWCRPHPDCLRFALEAWPRGSPSQNYIFAIFPRVFGISVKWMKIAICIHMHRHTYIHILTVTYTHAHKHAYMHTHIHMNAYAHQCTN